MTTATMIRDTSLHAYDRLQSTGKAGRQEQDILDAMTPGRGYTLQELSRLTGKPINVISGRVNGLKKKRLVFEGARRACTVTGSTVIPVIKPEAQGELFH